MRIFLFPLVLVCVCGGAALGQDTLYSHYVRKGAAALEAKEYGAAARAYSAAFQARGWKGYAEHRYAAARAWAMSGVADSAFFNLYRITEKNNYDEYEALTSEADFRPLHRDPRWADLCAKVLANRPSMPDLQKELLAIYEDDQKYRHQIDSIRSEYGQQSKEMKALWTIINEKDSLNLLKVTSILERHGWLGPKEVGDQASSTLFLVIQHSPLPAQEKYLPIMQAAVKSGKANAANLALLEDRVSLGQGKRQIYGSQIKRDKATGVYSIDPIEDPKNVDVRRAAVGLGPLADYVRRWGLIWNAEEADKMDKQSSLKPKN